MHRIIRFVPLLALLAAPGLASARAGRDEREPAVERQDDFDRASDHRDLRRADPKDVPGANDIRMPIQIRTPIRRPPVPWPMKANASHVNGLKPLPKPHPVPPLPGKPPVRPPFPRTPPLYTFLPAIPPVVVAEPPIHR